MSTWNFNLAAQKLLKFDERGEFYIVEAICRPKKDGESTLLGTTNNHTRMIRMCTFYNVESFNRMIDEMVKVCDANNARAYLLPQRRTTYGAMKAIIANALQNIDNAEVNFNRFISSSLCGMHESKHKRWVFDIDFDCPVLNKWCRETYTDAKVIVPSLQCKGMLAFYEHVKERVVKCGSGTADDVVIVPTQNGYHIVTPPFNPNACPKLGLGEIPQPYSPKWQKKDAMTLLYVPVYETDDDKEED